MQSLEKFVMKKLHNEKVVTELPQQAKEAEQKAKELEKMGVEFDCKWSKPFIERNKSIQK